MASEVIEEGAILSWGVDAVDDVTKHLMEMRIRRKIVNIEKVSEDQKKRKIYKL